MNIELISFSLCPFAQRAMILLKQQKLNYNRVNINPMNPPDWFKALSPTGQVPLLKVDEHIIFESDVIAEFINDISADNLHPENAITKANNRSWIAFSSTLFNDLFNMITADKQAFNSCKSALLSKLEKVEQVKNQAPFFNGDDFQLIDAAFAPFFMRLDWINQFTGQALSIAAFERLSVWSQSILALDAVQASVADGLDKVYYANIEAREGHLASLLID